MQSESKTTTFENGIRQAHPSEKMHKSFSEPDEVRDFKGHGHLDVLKFENGTIIGRGVFEPGWRWSSDVKPIAGTTTCESSHTGYCAEGAMTISMNDGSEFVVRAGEAFQIPAGHDAWVEGDEACVMVDVTGFQHYAEEKARH